MTIDRKRPLKPGPPGKTSERARYIQLMNQGFNNAESCRMLGIGRKTGSKWRNRYRHTDPKTGRVYTYPAITAVGERPNIISARYLSEGERITIADLGTAPERVCAR